MRRILIVAGTLAIAGCGSSTAGPANGPDLCATTQGFEVCAARAEYSPNETVTTTVRNTTAQTAYVDVCSVKPVGKTSRSAPFATDYSPQFGCGSDVDLDEIVSNMVELAPGASTQVTPKIAPFAFQGFYRINVWIVDAAGERVSNEPVFSGTFEVFPSAGT